MLTKLRILASLYRELGPRWTLFRLAYAFRLRTGLIRLQMPQNNWEDYRPERGGKRSFRPVDEVRLPENPPWNPQTAVAEADRMLLGEMKYFFHEYHQVDFPPNWHKDPVSGIELDSTKHWLQIPHDSVIAKGPGGRAAKRFATKSGRSISGSEGTASATSASQRHVDIKFIWEPNRFAFVYTLVRAYGASRDENYAEAFWTLIEDWAKHNPPNTGCNWMDGQEIALRLMAWTWGYQHFSNSPSSTPGRKSRFIHFVAAQAERIYKNIGYAVSTRSNHTISEAFGLWLVGLLFPEVKKAGKYLSLGRTLLEQEAAAQIFPDGGYSMYSLNYHRFILHIYLYMIRLGEINQSPVPGPILQKVESSIEYLSRLIDPQTGQMPVYGSNDGALVLPLNNCDFTDFRPLLQLGWYITKKEFLFDPGEWDEDVFWLCRESFTAKEATSVSEKKNPGDLRVLGGESFPDGGVYLLRNSNSKALIRCTDFRARPSHADQLHVDLWIRGHNVAIDAGTYLYSGEGHWRNGLAHTSVHNTVTVDGRDQMTMVSRFTWTNWSKGRVLTHDQNLLQGEHDSYQPVSHRRTVMALDGDRWLVIDHLVDKRPHHYALHWLLNDFPFEQGNNSVLLSLGEMKINVKVGVAEGDGNFSLVRADANSTRGWRSRYYGQKEPALSVRLEAQQAQVMFWSFFGFEGDQPVLRGKTLQIGPTEIDLHRYS